VQAPYRANRTAIMSSGTSFFLLQRAISAVLSLSTVISSLPLFGRALVPNRDGTVTEGRDYTQHPVEAYPVKLSLNHNYVCGLRQTALTCLFVHYFVCSYLVSNRHLDPFLEETMH